MLPRIAGRAGHSRYVQKVIATPTSVVLVDDAPEVRLLLRSVLRLSGRYQVVGEGGDGVEAIDLARGLRPDVLVLDVSMPQMDGIEALPLVREASPSTRVVLYTGFDPTTGLGERARDLGATAILQKSTDIDDFVRELDGVLGDRKSVV